MGGEGCERGEMTVREFHSDKAVKRNDAVLAAEVAG